MINHFTKGNKSAFAKAVGISNQSLGEIVGARQSAPSFAALQKIALAYPNVSLHWLVLGEGGSEIRFELTDEDQAYKLELYADEAEDKVADLVKSGRLPVIYDTPTVDSLLTLREYEEAIRVQLTGAIEYERILRVAQHKRQRSGEQDSAVDVETLAHAGIECSTFEKRYVEAVRNRIRAERALLGFNTSSVTAIYKLGEQEEPGSLYGGLLSNRIGISNEAAERLVESGKIRATYIDGEGYRITEQAVRIFLGEF